MFEKMRLKKKIGKCRARIVDIEKHRARSQAALVTAILSSTDPDEKDVEYFNNFTSQIEATRSEMHRLQEEYDALNKAD